MSANYTLGPAWIFTSDNITDPLSSWTKLAMTRDGVTVRTSSGFLSMARADQNGLTPLAESVRRVGAQLDGAETKFLNNDIDEILRAIPGGVKITNTTQEAIGFGQVTATLSPKAFAVVPVDDYNEDAPGSWYNSDNVWYFENALMEITGETSFALREGEDNLEGYTVDIKPFANATAGAYMGGRGLYRLLIQLQVTAGTDPISVSYNNDGTKVAVANFGSNSIMIVDVATAAVDDTVTVGTRPYSVSFNNDGTKVAVANEGSDSIMIVDVATAAVDDTVTVGTRPYSVSFNNDGTKVAVANYGSNNIMIVDVATAAVDDTVTVGTRPISVSYNNDGTKVAVANYDSDSIMIVDVATAAVDDTVTVGTDPISVSYNNDGTKVAVANFGSNNIMIVDVATAAVDDTVTVGTSPYSVSYNNDGTKVAVANFGSDNIYIVVGL